MKNSENILYSLIPLILIIVFTWLFGFIGSKMKKGQQSKPAGTEPEKEDNLFDLLLSKGEDEPHPSQAPPQPGILTIPAPGGGAGWARSGAPVGPQVTSKPIEPKWWGA